MSFAHVRLSVDGTLACQSELQQVEGLGNAVAALSAAMVEVLLATAVSCCHLRLKYPPVTAST